MSRYYIVYDGRANYDVDEASVLEALGEHESVEAAWADAEMWHEVDCVLVSYQVKDGSLIDEQVEALKGEGENDR